MHLKQKTISGLLWSFTDNFINLGITFTVGIILARLLSPREFGLIGMLTFFIAVSQSFINSGFSQALIRKKDPSQEDYSTVFYYNILISFICYSILYFGAGYISFFFKEPLLKPLVRIIGLTLIINAFTIIQQTILTRRIDFKLLTKISIISSIVSGLAAIIMATGGLGVWSLVVKTITMYSTTSILLWLWNKWKPIPVFSIQSFKELFSFGSNLLISGLINTIFHNLYYLVIGKYFSAQNLGYYTRAEQFSSLPSSNLTAVVQRVSYPVLSSISEDIPRLKLAYKKLIRLTMFASFFLMLGMAAIARPMVLVLIGEKWEPIVTYLQLICIAGMFYPLHALNLNMIQVEGRSDFFLRLEIIKKVLAIPIIIIGIVWGIEAMIGGMIMNNIIAYYLNSYWSGKLIGYSSYEQLKDIFPSFLMATVISTIIFLEGFLINLAPIPLLSVQLTTGVVMTVGICEILHFNDYLYLKEIARDKFYDIIRNKNKM